MNLLIVAATEAEIAPTIQHLHNTSLSFGEGRGEAVLITGVGMVATTYALTKHLQSHKYDLIIQAGVAGSYDKNISLGNLVFVTTDQYGDLGAEDHDKYLDIFEIGLLEKNTFPFSDGKLITPISAIHTHISLPHVNGITINTVSGHEQTIKRRAERYGATIESMEGAAFHEVCLREKIPFAQIRAISNYVTPRDKSQWKMKDAIINLNNWLIDFVGKILIP